MFLIVVIGVSCIIGVGGVLKRLLFVGTLGLMVDVNLDRRLARGRCDRGLYRCGDGVGLRVVRGLAGNRRAAVLMMVVLVMIVVMPMVIMFVMIIMVLVIVRLMLVMAVLGMAMLVMASFGVMFVALVGLRRLRRIKA